MTLTAADAEEQRRLKADGSWNAMSSAARDQFLQKWARNAAAAARQTAGAGSYGGGYTGGGSSGGASAAQAAEAAARRAAQANAIQSQINNMIGSRDNDLRGLDDIYKQRMDALNKSRADTLAGYLNDYNTQSGQINEAADAAKAQLEEERAQRNKDLYASQMAQQRNIGQQLALNGQTGGMSESTLAAISNEYGTNRGKVSQAFGREIGALERQKAQNLADLLNQHNARKAAYENYFQGANQDLLAEKAAAKRSMSQRYSDMLNSLNMSRIGLL